jgi:hypothetical protein
VETHGWKRAYEALVRHGRRLVMILAQQAGLVEPAKAAWRLLMDAVGHDKDPDIIAAACIGLARRHVASLIRPLGYEPLADALVAAP